MSLAQTACAAALATLLVAPARADAIDAIDAIDATPKHPCARSHDETASALPLSAERASKGGGLLSTEHVAATPAARELVWRATSRSGERQVHPLDR